MIIVEAKFYPFLLMSIQGDRQAEAEYLGMFEATEAVARKAIREKTRHVCISVGGGAMSASERRFVATRVAASPAEFRRVVIASFVVVDSAVFRGVLTALRWLAPSLVGIGAVGSIDAAMAAADETFRAHGIGVDPVCSDGARRWLARHANLRSTAESARDR